MDIEKIKEKYPDLFVNCWGEAYCGSGWCDIVDNLCTKLNKIMEDNPGFKIYIIQLKEKFGTLRCYIETENSTEELFKKVNEFVNYAEQKSSETCEHCGTAVKSGVRSTDSGWLVTLCDVCYQQSRLQSSKI